MTAVLCAMLGAGAIWFLTQNPDSKVSEAITDVAGEQTPADTQDTATDGEGDGAEGDGQTEDTEEPADNTTDDGGDTGEGTDSEEPEETPAATVDRTVSVRVLNAGSVAGQAGQFADKLTADGFTAVEAANFEGEPPTSSLIYYLGADNRGTAERVGEVLGITQLVEVESLRANISVVIR
jgi:hypothetical protein